jgi:RNA polymerase sigma-70 factor (ECF subfamily)
MGYNRDKYPELFHPFCNESRFPATNRVKGGEAVKDFGAVYGEYWDLVYGFLFRICKNASLAEELAQETFFQAMRAWDGFRGDSSVSTWLCAIAKRLYCSALRRETNHCPVLSAQENLPDVAEMLLMGDRKMAVQRVLHRLPEPYREVFTLRALCDLSHDEIGELFQKSGSWARVTYYRARMLLMEAMKEADRE